MINSCYLGDTRDGLRAFAAAGIRAQTCVTSPPYWGLRDYGSCSCGSGRFDLGHGAATGGNLNYRPAHQFDPSCAKCAGTGRILGTDAQIGLEQSPAEYVAAMVEVFRLVRDVLADDGTLWLNLGDSYAQNGGPGWQGKNGQRADRRFTATRDSVGMRDVMRRPPDELKPKDLVGIPWRVAFALQADGWFLRSDVIWHKPNPMPESVMDRPTKAHEYVFLLAKSERYFYDADAIAEQARSDHGSGNGFKRPARLSFEGRGNDEQWDDVGGSRNRRTVWTIATQPYADAHFAVMPRALVEPCVLAGTSAKGHCPKCGKGWERITERDRSFESGSGRSGNAIAGKNADGIQGAGYGDVRMGPTITTRTTGWQPSCDCNAGAPVPGVVLDPFLGSGTVAEVAQHLGRNWIGCELNSAYVDLQKRRTAQQGLALEAAD